MKKLITCAVCAAAIFLSGFVLPPGDNLKNAAEKGVVEAQYNLGVCYEFGKGVEKDLSEAVKWYRKAAEQGDAMAQYNLGILYFEGSGVDKNLPEAAKWFRKSAEQGDANAQYNYGVCLQNGYGVDKDKAKAYAWYTLSAKEGPDVSAELQRLSNELSPAQIQEAKELAEKYARGKFD